MVATCLGDNTQTGDVIDGAIERHTHRVEGARLAKARHFFFLPNMPKRPPPLCALRTSSLPSMGLRAATI